MIIMPILFQYRLIRQYLGMYVTKHAQQEKVTMVTILMGAPPYLSGLLDYAWWNLTVG